MKKLMTITLVCAIAFVIAACSSGGSEPKTVVEDYITALQKGNYQEALEYCNYTQEEKEKLAALLEEKAKQEDGQLTALKSFKIIDQQIDEEAGTAVVTVSVTNDKDETNERKLSLVKHDGKWLLKDAK
ncbi:MAG: DUF4878 domain-containing protein [Bacteroidaceae bacterium]|nr:DUF4878 domain-containing protein [Bacteroidaceae bacterium]MBR1787953.1 DUF4878 domain-containing protein [Bacteroidaceae bacterium]